MVKDASRNTLRMLDQAVHDHAGDAIGDDEAVVAWVMVVGVRGATGGGDVIVIDDGESPRWQGKGMLIDGLDLLRRMDWTDDPPRDGEPA